MTPLTRRQTLAALLGSAGSALTGWAPCAQAAPRTWPVETVKLIVPAPAGGGVDILCRSVADRLAAMLGASFVIDNRAGAGGLLGARALASAAPDGGTLGYLHAGHLTLQAMGAKLDMVGEFAPVVGRFTASQFVIAVPADSKLQTLADLTRAITTTPGTLSYGTGGQGSPGHLVVEKLRARMPGLDAVHVPYKGAVEAVNALVGKNLDFLSGLMSSVLPQVKSGRLRALAVSGEQRSHLLPDVPTLAESGFAGFSHVSWGGFYAPAKTPSGLLAQLREALAKVADEPSFKALLDSTGSELRPVESPQAFEAYLKSGLVAETALMAKLGLKIQ